MESSKPILFSDVRIFDGRGDSLSEPKNVLVRGELIDTISCGSFTDQDIDIIEGSGRTLMPGLIDTHVHLDINRDIQDIVLHADRSDLAIRSTVVARDMIMDGWTSVRDVGGSPFGLRRSIESGLVVGPRIFASGPFISQTSGHGDFGCVCRPNLHLHGREGLDQFEQLGLAHIVDGRDQILAAVRQNLRSGANLIKVMGGGGGASPYDPIDTTQYTIEEWKAAVDATEDWGTYVTSHIFTPRAIKRAIESGVKCLEHAFFMDEETIKLVSDRGIYVVPQAWAMSSELFSSPNLDVEKHEAIRALQNEYSYLPKMLLDYGVKVGYGSDTLGPPEVSQKCRRYELYCRAKWFGSIPEVLKQATSVSGEILSLSGPRNPYRNGSLGVVEEGAYADLLLIDGNPLEDLSVLGANSKWWNANAPKDIETMCVIMKGGNIIKNTA